MSGKDKRLDDALGTNTEAAGQPIDARIGAVYDALTDSEQRLADVVLEAAGSLSAFTAGELAAQAGVSNATAARFFRRLGYGGYADARRAARAVTGWGSPLSELTGRTVDPSRSAGDFARHIAQDADNLRRTAELVRPEQLALATDILSAAKRVTVVGFRNSAALAAYARGLIAHLRADVRLLPLAGQTLAEDMAGIGADDAFLVFGFRRRPPVLREILAVAGEAGARSVLVADPTAARSAHLATVTLRCAGQGASLFDSYAAAMSVTNFLCAALRDADAAAAARRLAEIEVLHQRFGAGLGGVSRGGD